MNTRKLCIKINDHNRPKPNQKKPLSDGELSKGFIVVKHPGFEADSTWPYDGFFKLTLCFEADGQNCAKKTQPSGLPPCHFRHSENADRVCISLPLLSASN